jgi:hypothetical protein
LEFFSKKENGNALHLASKIPSLSMIKSLSEKIGVDSFATNLDGNLKMASSKVKPGYLSSRKMM